MSNAVFPSALLKNVLQLSRVPEMNVGVMETAGGREIRQSWWLAPRQRFRLGIRTLRTGTSRREFQSVLAHVARHFGALDSFLIADPDDCSVTDHGFGTGDGTTTSFQLQRAAVGDRETATGAAKITSKAVTNILPRSQDFATGPWACTAGALVTPNAETAPDGTATACRYSRTGAGYLYQAQASYFYDQTQTFSVYAKNGGANTLLIMMAGLGNNVQATFDLTTGTAYNIPDGQTAKVEPLANGWFRISVTGVVLSTTYNETQLIPGNTGAVYLWGAQIELGDAPTTYILTTAAALKQTPSYWPLLDGGFTPVWEPHPGIVISDEGTWRGKRTYFRHSRTNFFAQSAAMSTSPWIMTGVTATTGQAAPDGTTTAVMLTDAAPVAGHVTQQTVVGAVAGQVYTFSVYVKAGTGYATLNLYNAGGAYGVINLANGGVYKQGGANLLGNVVTQNLFNGWYRLSVSILCPVSANIIAEFWIGDATLGAVAGSGRTVTFWGAQMESGPTATTYIPTVGSQVTATPEYTLGSNGIVTFTAAPAAGLQLTWSGSFFRRVRFVDSPELRRLVSGAVYSAESVELLEVKP